MPRVSSIKTSPIAKYLTENKVKAHKNPNKNGIVEFRNADNKILGILSKGEAALNNYRYINIDLFKPDEKVPFLSQNIIIEKTQKYFLQQHSFMPTKIEIEKVIKDFEHNILKKETITRGLASHLYIDKIKESEVLKAERQKIGVNTPEDFPIYEINKPFKYEFKAHLYYPVRAIDSSKPVIKEH